MFLTSVRSDGTRRASRLAGRVGSVALVASLAVLANASSVGAHNSPEPHDHFMLTSSGMEVQVGPPVCDHANLHTAFHNFHSNVHRGSPTTTGSVVISRVAFCQA